jgi:hypothetical protein
MRIAYVTALRRVGAVASLLIAIAVTLAGCGLGTGTDSGMPTGSGTYHFGVQTKTTDCKANGPLPDSGCTPGAIFSDATVDKICTPGYASSVRNVSTSLKNQVYASYGITTHYTGQYEVDHLVSLELGGSNDISNLWPEAANPTPGFHQKDQLENYLHDQVCAGKMPLEQAQIEIATNWLTIYQQMQSGG